MHYLAILAYPFIPGAAHRMLEMLGLPEETIRWEPPASLAAGHQLGEPSILFEKLQPGCMD